MEDIPWYKGTIGRGSSGAMICLVASHVVSAFLRSRLPPVLLGKLRACTWAAAFCFLKEALEALSLTFITSQVSGEDGRTKDELRASFEDENDGS